MAIAFRAQSHTGGVGANPTATEPTGTTLNDVLVALFSGNENSLTAPVAPSGWTTLAASVHQQTTDFLSWNLAWIRRGASAPALGWTGGAAGYSEVIIFCFSGVDQTTAIDSQSVTGATGNTGGHNSDPPSTTAVTPNTMAVTCGVMWAGCNTAFTPPAGYTLPYTGAGEQNAFAYKALSASGVEDPGAFGDVHTGADNSYWDGFTLTLKTDIPPTVDGAQTFRRDQRRPGPYQPMGGANRNPRRGYH